eukprot:g5962.t1
MYPTRLNLHNKHLPPSKVEVIHDVLRVGYGEPRNYGKSSSVNMSIESTVKKFEKQRYKLDYSGMADAKGLIYFIGTDGMQHPFENPSMKNKGLNLTIVKGSNRYGVPLEIVNRSPGYKSLTGWKDIKQSYIEIDLQSKVRLRPNRYMIRCGMTGPNFTPTDWVLEGIECDKNGYENVNGGWKIIKNHTSDLTLFEKSCNNINDYVAQSFTINDDVNFGKEDGGFYSRFRVRLTNNNVNGNAYLSVSSIEFWGLLEIV